MDKLTENPGFNQLTQDILIFLNYNTLLKCRKVNHSMKKNVDSPNFWLRKMRLYGMSRKRYLNWCRLIDLLENIPNDSDMKGFHEKTMLSLIKMYRSYPNSYFLPLIPKTVGTILHISADNGHTEIVKSLINCMKMNTTMYSSTNAIFPLISKMMKNVAEFILMK